MEIRRMDFAGSWYPGSDAACTAQIQSFLNDMKATVPEAGGIGGIVPHAGWYFSGHIACRVIQALAVGTTPDIIVIFGMHLPETAPPHIFTGDACETPLGNLMIHTRMAAELSRRFDFQHETPRRHSHDNTIELQLPLIKYFFPESAILPIGLPPVPLAIEIGAAVAEIARAQQLDIRVIGSTDLTHYGHNYGFTPQGTGPGALSWVRQENDQQIIKEMLALNADNVLTCARTRYNACCAGAAAGAIAAATTLGAGQATLATYATSHDRAPSDSFVGYAGIVMQSGRKR